MLQVNGLEVGYGAIRAVRGIDLTVGQGEVVALLGPNGAGKTSTLMAIMGVVPPRAGRVVFEGQDLTGLAPEAHVRAGLSLVPEGRRIFAPLSVLENLTLGAAARSDRAAAAADLDEMLALFPVLAERRHQRARCLMGRPRMILLDEPSLGLAPQVVEAIFELIARLRDRGLTLLVVEQNVEMSLAIADRGYVLVGGEIALAGPASTLLAAEGVERAYLGLAEG
jgi:branched-chain amino acid transport system ATP-binding protein